jgi:hypothetical protein
MRVKAAQSKICAETEGVFNSAFWGSIDVVATALVCPLLYILAQKCFVLYSSILPVSITPSMRFSDENVLISRII